MQADCGAVATVVTTAGQLPGNCHSCCAAATALPQGRRGPYEVVDDVGMLRHVTARPSRRISPVTEGIAGIAARPARPSSRSVKVVGIARSSLAHKALTQIV